MGGEHKAIAQDQPLLENLKEKVQGNEKQRKRKIEVYQCEQEKRRKKNQQKYLGKTLVEGWRKIHWSNELGARIHHCVDELAAGQRQSSQSE